MNLVSPASNPLEAAFTALIAHDKQNIVFLPSFMFLKLPSNILNVNQLIEEKTELYQRLPKYFMNKDNALQALQRNPLNLAFIPEELLDNDLIRTALTQEPLAIGYVKDKFRLFEYCLHCVIQKPETLGFLNEQQQSQFMVEMAIEKNPACIMYVAPKYMTYRLIKKAVTADNRAIEGVPSEFIDDELLNVVFAGQHFILDMVDRKNPKFITSHRINQSLNRFPVETLVYLINEKSSIEHNNIEHLDQLIQIDPIQLQQISGSYFWDREELLISLIRNRPDFIPYIVPSAYNLKTSILAYKLNPEFKPMDVIVFDPEFMASTAYLDNLNWSLVDVNALGTATILNILNCLPENDERVYLLLGRLNGFQEIIHHPAVQAFLEKHRQDIYLALNPALINTSNMLTVNTDYLTYDSLTSIDLHIKDDETADQLLAKDMIFYSVLSHDMKTQDRTLKAIEKYPSLVNKIPLDLLNAPDFLRLLVSSNPLMLRHIGKITEIEQFVA